MNPEDFTFCRPAFVLIFGDGKMRHWRDCGTLTISAWLKSYPPSYHIDSHGDKSRGNASHKTP